MQEIVEDISVDTTFPTDFSISQDEITSELQTTDDDPLASRPLHYQNAQSKSHRPHPSASKGVAEQQLRLDLQKVNVQLKEKSIKFDNLKAEYIRKVNNTSLLAESYIWILVNFLKLKFHEKQNPATIPGVLTYGTVWLKHG